MRTQDIPGDGLRERHYSVSELAVCWNISYHTVRRIFLSEPGVMRVNCSEGKSGKRVRMHQTLRIPESVAQHVYMRLTGDAA